MIWISRALIPVFLVGLVGCYIPPRPLPGWKVDRMASSARVPCSSFSKGQRLGDGARVDQVRRGYVVIRTRDRESVVVPCRGR